MSEINLNVKNKGLIINGIIIVVIIIMIFAVSPFKIIGAGERGVKTSRINGVDMTPLGEGINFVMPFVYTIEVYDVKIQKYEMTADCATSDLQDIKVKLAVNYKLDVQKIAKLHQEIGVEFIYKVIRPSVEESIKAATAKFQIEEVIKRRDDLRQLSIKGLKKKFDQYGIILQDISIVEIAFSQAYSKSVEEKQIQKQRIETKKNERLQAEEEKKKVKILAEARAYEWIKKWDGKLPTYMGSGGNNFMNIPVR